MRCFSGDCDREGVRLSNNNKQLYCLECVKGIRRHVILMDLKDPFESKGRFKSFLTVLGGVVFFGLIIVSLCVALVLGELYYRGVIP